MCTASRPRWSSRPTVSSTMSSIGRGRAATTTAPRPGCRRSRPGSPPRSVPAPWRSASPRRAGSARTRAPPARPRRVRTRRRRWSHRAARPAAPQHHRSRRPAAPGRHPPRARPRGSARRWRSQAVAHDRHHALPRRRRRSRRGRRLGRPRPRARSSRRSVTSGRTHDASTARRNRRSMLRFISSTISAHVDLMSIPADDRASNRSCLAEACWANSPRKENSASPGSSAPAYDWAVSRRLSSRAITMASNRASLVGKWR